MEYDKDAVDWVKSNCNREHCTNKSYGSPRMSSEYQDCSTPFSLDVWSICSGGCSYCFSYFQKSNNPAYKNGIELKSINVKHLIDVFEGKYPNNPYYKAFIKKRYVLHIGGMSDNFDMFEEKYKKGVPLIEYLLKTKYPMIISTKFNLERIPEYKKLFEKYKENNCCAVQFSIVTTDIKKAILIEYGIPSPETRFKSMKWLSDLGYYTILRLRPFIVGVSDVCLDDLLTKAKNAGARSLSTEFFCLESRSNPHLLKRYDAISEASGFDIIPYYKKLSPSERGGYLRLNRDVKERWVKQMYVFCKDNDMIFGCSDPDFKELNSTGSCCGLPDDVKWGLNNYCKAQLTQMLVMMRKKWLQNEEDVFLTWQDILNNDAEYMTEKKFYGDSLKCWDTDYSRDDMTHQKEFKQVWNNIRSPKNPYNYFHGILKPCGVDKDNNIIFKFNAPNYMKRWKKEKII